jgi:hypothetical protein
VNILVREDEVYISYLKEAVSFLVLLLTPFGNAAFCPMTVAIFANFHSLGHKHVFLSFSQEPGTISTALVSINSTTAKPVLNKELTNIIPKYLQA